jgi:hypothetical protein
MTSFLLLYNPDLLILMFAAPKQVKSVLNKHKKRDSWFFDNYSVNLYEGCDNTD